MKKIIPVLIAIVLIASTAVSVFAATPTQIRITTTSAAAQPGDTIDFTVSIDEVTDCRSGGIVLQYDTGIFEFVSGQCLVTNPFMADFSGGTGVFAFTAGQTVSNTIFRFTLRLKDTAPYGTHSISAAANFRNSDGQIDSQVIGTSVTIRCDHVYGSWANTNANTHSRTCSACGNAESVPHTWNEGKTTKNPTCKDEGQKTYSCTVCDATKSESIPQTADHIYGSWEKNSDSTHSRSCTTCGKSESVAHTWNSGTVSNNPTCKEEGRMTYSCTVCDATKSESIPQTADHTYGSWKKTSDSTHSRSCTTCGKSESVAHTWNSGTVSKNPTCKEEGRMTYSCTTCDAAKSESIPQTTDHTYDNSCDTACNRCGTVRETRHQFSTKWSSNGSGHWHTCTICGEKADSAAHIPGKDATETAPQTCTICGYVIRAALGHRHSLEDTLTFDEDGHWYACTGCDAREPVPHTFDSNCDTTCDACGYARTITHTMNQEWSADADGHWHECSSCGEMADSADHTPGAEATEEASQVCTACGYVLVPALDPTEPSEEAQDVPEDTNPGETAEEDIEIQTEPAALPWWLAIPVLVVLGGVVTVICLVVKRK